MAQLSFMQISLGKGTLFELWRSNFANLDPLTLFEALVLHVFTQ